MFFQSTSTLMSPKGMSHPDTPGHTGNDSVLETSFNALCLISVVLLKHRTPSSERTECIDDSTSVMGFSRETSRRTFVFNRRLFCPIGTLAAADIFEYERSGGKIIIHSQCIGSNAHNFGRHSFLTNNIPNTFAATCLAKGYAPLQRKCTMNGRSWDQGPSQSPLQEIQRPASCVV